MRRLTDNVLELVDSQIALTGKTVLEIGCGNGAKTLLLAQKAETVCAIDPDEAKIDEAQRLYTADKITYIVGSAEKMNFADHSFDVVIFTSSLHHVPLPDLGRAIAETIRVVHPNGRIVCIEPGFMGSFYEAEYIFGASDGDERLVKAQAYASLLQADGLSEIMEIYGKVTLEFDSVADFVKTMRPDKNEDEIAAYLEAHDFTLHAYPRINILRITSPQPVDR